MNEVPETVILSKVQLRIGASTHSSRLGSNAKTRGTMLRMVMVMAVVMVMMMVL